MAERSDLLPPNHSELEAAVLNATEPPIDAALLRTARDPATIARALLPWMAWERHVPYWDQALSEEIQRIIVADSQRAHAEVGTLAAYKRIARYLGVEIASVRRPPDKTFLGAALSKAERNAWLAQLDQLRIYPYRNRGRAAGSHLGYCYPGAVDDAGICWGVKGDAAARVGEVRYLYGAKTGVETQLVTVDYETGTHTGTATVTREVRIRSTAGLGTCVGAFARYLVHQHAERRLYRVTEGEPYDVPVTTLRLRTAYPKADPISIDYQWVPAKGRAVGTFLAERFPVGARRSAHCCAGWGLVDHHARSRIYKRFYLHNPNATLPTRRATTHLGAARLGMTHHTAIIQVRMRRRPAAKVGFLGRRMILGSLYGCDTGARERVERVRQALEFARAGRDQILLNTTTRTALSASPAIACGSGYYCGQFTNEVH